MNKLSRKFFGSILTLTVLVSGVLAQVVTLDVVVVITDDVIDMPGVGSESAARSIAASKISEANSIYSNSNTNARLRMVGSIVVGDDLSSDDIYDQIDYLTGSTAVADARERYSPDLVTMLVSTGSDSNIFGIVSDIPDRDDRNSVSTMESCSYSVTRLTTTSYNRFTYAHEVGHSLGAAHNVSSLAWDSYAHGYGITYGALSRNTVLGSSGHTTNSHRIAYLSNPNITYTESPYFSSVPIGVTNANDNARALRESPQFIDDIGDTYPFYNSTISDDEWHYYSWWNWFWVGEYEDEWIYHNHHGYLYVPRTSNSSNMVYWDYELGGWIYTDSTNYPWVYSYDDDTWYEYVPPSTNPRNFTTITAPKNVTQESPN